jgi:hypothetical protein
MTDELTDVLFLARLTGLSQEGAAIELRLRLEEGQFPDDGKHFDSVLFQRVHVRIRRLEEGA